MYPEYVDPPQKEPKLLPWKHDDAFLFPRPGEGFLFEPLLPQAEARAVPVEDFYQIPPLAKKDKVTA